MSRPVDTGLDETALLACAARTCYAMAPDGVLKGWGLGNACLLGPATSMDTDVPQVITSTLAFTQLEAGDNHVLGLAAGRVYGWGVNNAGQLAGQGDRCDGPVYLGFDGVRQVSAGSDHSCILHNDGRVTCFGGAGSLRERVPQPVSLAEPAVEIRSGYRVSCAILTSARVECWGTSSEAASGAFFDLSRGADARIASGVREALALDVGGSGFACFIRDEGIFCWGSNASGQTGHSSVMRPAAILSESVFTQTTVGGRHGCGLDAEDKVQCWGKNDLGQTGLGRKTWAEPLTLVPGITASKAAAGFSHTCTIGLDGQVSCWGGSGVGALRPQVVAGLPRARGISAGADHTCIVSTDDEVWCWGTNVAGSVDPTEAAQVAPSRLTPRRVPGIGRASEVVTGNQRTCALELSKEVRCWGEGATHTYSGGWVAAATTPRLYMSDATAISANETSNCAVRQGEVWCWGNNRNGRLGSNSPELHYDEPQKVEAISGVSMISGKTSSTCALTGEREVWCWGQDFLRGRLGRGPSNDAPSPVKVPGLPAAIHLSTSYDSSCITSAEGQIWCWGFDDHGVVSASRFNSAGPSRVILAE